MKTSQKISFFILFLAALLGGFKIGSNLGAFPIQTADRYATPMDASPPNQHNLLLIHIDQLDQEKPRLRSIWLMAYYDNSPRVDLLPIYPFSKPGSEAHNSQLESSFSLTSSGEPVEDFWHAMESINTWWNAYLLLDDTAAQRLGQTLGKITGIENQGGLDNAAPQSSSTVPIEVEAGFYSALCKNFTQNTDQNGFAKLLFSLNGHTHTNLKPGQLHDTWQLLSAYQDDLNCNFPSLHGTIP